MPLREEFDRSGNWLFRRRSYLPVLLYGLVLIALTDGDSGIRPLSETWELVCLGIALCGVLIRALVVGYTPSGTSGRTTQRQVADSLNTAGMYSVVRHPLYLGNAAIWLGIAMLPRDVWLALVIMLIFWIYYERIMFAEEEFIRAKFGEPYESWAMRTPAILPRPSLWRPPELPFSVRNVLRREYSSVLAIGISFAAIDLVEDFTVTGELLLDPIAATVLALATILYFTLLTLNRRTNVLRIPGR